MTTNGFSPRALARREMRRAGTPARRRNAEMLALMAGAR